MKLRTKIQLFASLFMLLILLLVNTSVYFLFYRIAADGELDQLSTQTDALVETLADSDVASGELLKAYLPAEGMIRVIGEDGNVILMQRRASENEALPWEFSTSESQEIVEQNNTPPTAVISKPVIWNNGEVVTVQVSNQLVHLRETMTTLFLVLAVASIIMLVPTVIAANVLSRFLLRPIQKLIQAMKENTGQNKWEKIDLENRSRDELYEMEKTFNEMIDQLQDNFTKQERFVSDASHELKTPISIVKSYAQLLERRGADNPNLVQESVEAIDTEADRMKKLVEQMLALAKNKQKSQTEDVELVPLCEETAATFQGAYPARRIDFATVEEQLRVTGSRDQLEQVLYILLDNALKYTSGEVRVRISREDEHAVVRVKDFGKGIPKAEQARIFERFYRIDKARSRDTGGTGLGLAIAVAIAEGHQGSLAVDSKEGEGTTFFLRLPLAV